VERGLGSLLGIAAATNSTGGVVDADSVLHRWAEVDNAAARLASCLVAAGVEGGDRVAVLHPKSLESFIAVHAIVRCGAVMVPVDPLGPVDGVESVLRFCDPRAIVGAAATLQARAKHFITDRDIALVVSGDLTQLTTDGKPASKIVPFAAAISHRREELPEVSVDDLAYIIFTSGSTGEPKGIAHTHRSAMAYVENACAVHGLTAADRVAGTSPLHFDMSTLELYATPLAGATAVTITEAMLRFPASLSNRLADTDVSVVYAVPYQLRQLCLRGDLANRDLSSLRQVGFGGEQFAPGVLAELAKAVPSAELLNVYGPAEVNGIVSQRWAPNPSELRDVPIGRAWPGVRLRIVDDDLVEVPAGEAGELLAACASQMTGYWRRPDLDERCFIDTDGQRWYRTGDVVQSETEGVLHFLGRADSRVKVRGVRFELETIESVLGDAPGIDSAVVGVSENDSGVQEVVAWVRTDTTSDVSVTELRRWCRTRLPESAVPSDVRFVDSFAETRTGKIDRKALRATLTTPTA